MKSPGRIILKIVCGAIALVLIAGIVVWVKPDLIVNERLLKFAAGKLRDQGIESSWESADVKIRNESVLGKSLRIAMRDLCVESPTQITGCFSEVDVAVHFRLSIWGVELTHVGPVLLVGQDIQLKSASARVDYIRLRGFEDGKTPRLHLITSGALISPDKSQKAFEGTAELTADPLHSTGTRPFQLIASVNSGKQQIIFDSKGEIQGDRISGTLNGDLLHPAEGVSKVDFKECSYKVDPYTGPRDKRIELDCPILVVPRQGDLRRALPKKALPLEATLRATVNAGFDNLDGKFQLKIPEVDGAFYQLNATSELVANGSLKDFPSKLKLKPALDFRIKVEDFQKLTNALMRTPWSIPRPLNVLRGEVSGNISSSGGGKDAVELPFKLETLLASERQHFDTLAEGMLVVPRQKDPIQLKSDVTIKNIALVLPELQFLSLPPVVPDSRFTKRGAKREVASQGPAAFEYDIRVRTESGKSLRLISSLSKQEIPIEADLALRSQKDTEGTIKIQNVTLDLFNRSALVEHFKLASSPKEDAFDIDGKIRVNYSTYVFYIEVLGTTSQPQVLLSSTPPMTREQILSVLLFGKSPSELGADESTSLSSVQASLTDQALGLLSLYALASTPIERVGYNAATKQVSLQVKVGKQSSLIVGSDFDKMHMVGVKRALGGNWWVQTYLNQDVRADKSSVTALLEWIKRF